MILIIDGHNLVPHIPGLSLEDADDESRLIGILQEYALLLREAVEGYFDLAPAARAAVRKFGRVEAHFVRSGTTADEAIIARLQQLGARAKNVQVVSSDRQVQRAARAAHARVISSGEFASESQALMDETPALNPRNRLLSEQEVDAWERLFRRGHPSGED